MTWIQTWSGVALDLLDPKPTDIHAEDIAAALSKINRFTGHTSSPYSVASHSLLVMHYARPEHRLQALLHDAAEYAVGDVSTPLKAMVPQFRKIEDRVHAAICARFDLPPKIPDEVKAIDLALLWHEAAVLLGDPPKPWGAFKSGKIMGLPNASRYVAASAGADPQDVMASFLEALSDELTRRSRLN